MDLNTPLTTVSPVFRMKGKLLEKLGIKTIEDLFYYAPFRYDNNILVAKIGTLQPGENATIQGRAIAKASVFTKRGMTMQKITVQDETGKIECVFFNQKFILTTVNENDFVSFAGRVERFGKRITMSVRNYEVLKDENSDAIHTTGLVPIYSETRGIYSKWIRNRIKNFFDQNIPITEFIPKDIIKKNGMMELSEAIYKIHFPKTLEEAETARQRLSFDELFLKHIASLVRKKEWQAKEKAIPFETEKYKKEIEKLIKSLSFKLTAAQTKAIEDIFKDLEKQTPMNRLLEGDVGSGKTIVAGISVYLAYLNGFQSAFMAPTEILANQHFATLKQVLEPFGLKVELFTGSNKKKKSVLKEINSKTKKQEFDVAVGTHALIHNRAAFENLGLVVIDEQQRFGVEQRAILREKGTNPHLLSMTATPIPRTIFLTLYSDLALSVLDELPAGRKKIKTWVVPEIKRQNAYKWIEDKVRTEQSQVFIVCPFIEPSETLNTIKAAKEEFENLKKNIFPKLRLGLLHGKLKAAEKDSIVEEFRAGEIDILVATPVIEVGIDIPTADIIMVEASERFGLAQLHQLRGRVGRGQKQSYCLLFTTTRSEKTQERLSYLQTIDNGMELAEVDLKLRGPGEMFGTAQSGIPGLKIATLSDAPLIKLSRDEAEEIFEDLNEYPTLFKKVEETETPKISKD